LAKSANIFQNSPSASLVKIRQPFSKLAKCEFGQNPTTFLKNLHVHVWSKSANFSQNSPSASLAKICQLATCHA
jgi:hypothetical protein